MSKEELANDKIEFGRILRSLRNETEMSQDDVVERSGLARNQVISIEKGTGNPTMDTLLKYLNAVGGRLNAESQW